jgi:hypothetical protein
MTLTEFGMLLLFLMVFCIVPMIFIQCGFRSKPGAKANLQECPKCGAQNYKVNTHCYCCGYGFIPAQPEGIDATLIQRVKQADESRKSSRAKARTPQSAEDETVPTDKAI